MSVLPNVKASQVRKDGSYSLYFSTQSLSSNTESDRLDFSVNEVSASILRQPFRSHSSVPGTATMAPKPLAVDPSTSNPVPGLSKQCSLMQRRRRNLHGNGIQIKNVGSHHHFFLVLQPHLILFLFLIVLPV